MSMLDLDLRHVSGVSNSIQGTISRLEKRKSDYQDVIRSVNTISSSTGNLSTCNTYLDKKNRQLQEKIDKLNSLKNRVETFSSNAQAADSRVAKRVTDDSKAFYKTVGIKTGWSAFWEGVGSVFAGVGKLIKKGWEAVKQFYEDHKFIIDLVVDAVMLVVAVVALIAAVPTGGATLFFAAFALANALGDVVTSSVAFGCHLAGDDEQAELWAKRGLKDGVKFVAKKVGGIFGEEVGLIMESLAGFAYDGLTLASTIYSLGKLGQGLFKSIDLRNTNEMSIFQRFTNAAKKLVGVSITDTSGKSLASCWQLKEWLHLKSVDSARNIMITCDIIKDIKAIYKTADSVMEGTFFVDGNKLGSSIKKVISTVKGMYQEEKEKGYLRKALMPAVPILPLGPLGKLKLKVVTITVPVLVPSS